MLSNKVRVIFQGRSLQACLDDAYGKFHSWCVDNRSTTSIMSFEKTKFKVIQCRSYTYDLQPKNAWGYIELHGGRYVPGPISFGESVWNLRPNQFPRGCGKAYDTALLCKWLHFELEQHCLESEVPR